MATPMTPSPALSFVNGPSLADPALGDWLAVQENTKAVLRLPVVVDFGGPLRLGVKRAWLGSDLAEPTAASRLLKLDDTTMSVSLMDHLRTACPTGDRCAIWVEAQWGAPVAMPAAMAAFESGPARSPVTVRRFGGVAAEPATHVQVAE